MYKRQANIDSSVLSMRIETDQPGGNTGVNFAWDYDTTNADGYTASGVFDADAWVHIALVCTASAVTKVYRNGTEISYNLQTPPSGTPTSPAGLYLVMGWDNDITSSYWKGKIGGFLRLWRRALTTTEVRREMNNHLCSAFEDGLLVNLKFREESGTTIENESSPSYPCNLVNTPSWTSGPDIVDKVYPSRNLEWNNVMRPAPFTPGLAR